jgi:hypothetical protein
MLDAGMMGEEKDDQAFLVGAYGPTTGACNEEINERKCGVA